MTTSALAAAPRFVRNERDQVVIFLHLGLATVFRIKTNQPLILLVNFADRERNGLVQIKNSFKKFGAIL